MTLEQAKALRHGDEVHYTGRRSCSVEVGPRGGRKVHITRCRVTGKPKTWKRDVNRVYVPVMYGLYEHGYITQYNINEWHLASECPVLDR